MMIQLFRGSNPSTPTANICSWLVKEPAGSNPYQPGNYSCQWEIGKDDDTIVPGSDYWIGVMLDPWLFGAKSNPFTIAQDPRKWMDEIRRIKAFDCKFPPGCPLCGILDLSELRGILAGNPDPLKIFLFFRGLQVAVIGQSGRGGTLADSLQVRFTADSFAAIKKGGAQFELRFIDGKGIMVHSQIVQIAQSR